MLMPMRPVMVMGMSAVTHCHANECCGNLKVHRPAHPMPLQFEIMLPALVVDINCVATLELFCTNLRAGNTRLVALIPCSSFHFASCSAPGSVFQVPFVSKNIMAFLLLCLHPRAHNLMSPSALVWRSRCDPNGQFCVVCMKFLGEL